MSDYRRYLVPGGTYFFTVVTDRRRRFLVDDQARECLRDAFRTVRKRYPFEVPAIVLLPDHLHAVWTLPPGDSAYSLRWSRIKRVFTEKYMAMGGVEGVRSISRHLRNERAVWQRRFWEHAVEDELDLERHIDYIHYNPVKHGFVPCPRDWPYSSFHRWVRLGSYPPEWGCLRLGSIPFDTLDETAME